MRPKDASADGCALLGEPDVMPVFLDPPSRPEPAADEVRQCQCETTAPPPFPVSGATIRNSPAGPGETPSRHRGDECVPNIPDIEPETFSGEVARHPDGCGDKAQEEVPDIPAGNPGWLRRGYLAFVLLLSALFILFVFGQTASTLALAASLPRWAQWVFLPAMGVCGLVVLGVCICLVRSWFGLRAIRQVNLDALGRLRDLAESRQMGIRRYREARERITRYLVDYPLGESGAKRADADEESLRELRQAREYLLALGGDSRTWLEAYVNQFQRRLDERAEKAVRGHALRAALCAMASPVPLLDAILVLGVAMRMLSSLCRIYNLRVGSATLPMLLAKVVQTAFLAGIGQEAAAFGVEKAGDFLQLLSKEESAEFAAETAGEGVLGAAGSSVAKFAGAKLAEGAVNGLFTRRLGRAAIRLLRPIRP